MTAVPEPEMPDRAELFAEQVDSLVLKASPMVAGTARTVFAAAVALGW